MNIMMEWHKNWLWMRSESLLPTTVLAKSQSSSTVVLLKTRAGEMYGNLVRRFRRTSGDIKQDQNNNSTESDEVFDENWHFQRPKHLMSGAFPSYLNNGVNVKSPPNRRRSSLLEGLEQTMNVMKNNERIAQLALPRKRIAHNNKHVSSALPIPILPLREFKTSGSLYGYLDNGQMYVETNQSKSTKVSIIMIVLIFLSALGLILSVYNNFPELDENERDKIKLPSNIDDAKELGKVLSKYKDTNYYEVITAFFITYIFLQTFAIPGSVFLSILSGFLYPFYIALFLVCMCSGIGATGCYLISYFIGKPLVNKYLAERVRSWNEVVDGQREHLFNYLLFLRITPFLPNWFINIVSPVIHIPISLFFFATFIGVAPLSFIAIQAGTTLYQLTTAGDAFSWTGIIIMGVLAVLSIVPVLLKNYLKKKFE